MLMKTHALSRFLTPPKLPSGFGEGSMAGAKKTQGGATDRNPLNWREHSGSRLLTPDSCTSRNEGSSGYMYENKSQ